MHTLRALASISLGLLACGVLASHATQGPSKIAFLRDDALWIARSDRQGAERVTAGGVTVDDFRISPGGRYLAYSAVVGSAEEPGIWDSTETPPERPVCSLVVLDRTSGSVVFRSDSGWIYLARWLPGERLLYYDSDGFAVNNHYELDPVTGEVKTFPIPDARMIGSDFSPDGALEAFAGEDGRSLHVFDRARSGDTVIFTTRGLISESRFSSDARQIAVMEVQTDARTSTDIVWIVDRSTGKARVLDRHDSRPKYGGEQYLAWSPDDRLLGLFFPPHAVVMDVQDPVNRWSVPGGEFGWLQAGMLFSTHEEGIFIHDIATRSERLILPGASKGALVR